MILFDKRGTGLSDRVVGIAGLEDRMDDVRAVAKPVLRHRILTNFNAEAESVSADNIVDRLIERIPLAENGETNDGPLSELI